MSVTVKVTDKELRKALRNIAQWSEAKKKRIATVVTTSAINVERVAKELAPTDMGRLKDAITRQPVGLALEATVSNNVEYAAAVEFGRGPGKPPPIAPLLGWVKRQGMDAGAAYAIQKTIAKKGTKPQPHMNPAAERERPNFTKKIRAALKADERVV